jgi:Protein of unknown function (DUF1579)
MSANRMARLEIFIGTWNTTGEVLETASAPAAKLSATDTYRWLPGKRFIVHDADARFGEDVSRSIEVIGFDHAGKKYLAHSYDDQGVSEIFEVGLKGLRWRIKGDTARFSGKFDPRQLKLTGLWELKDKKVGWQPWIKLTLARGYED